MEESSLRLHAEMREREAKAAEKKKVEGGRHEQTITVVEEEEEVFVS